MRIYENGIIRELTKEETAEVERQMILANVLESSRPLSDIEITDLFIRQNIDSLSVDDTTAVRMKEKYPEWKNGVSYTTDTRRMYTGNFYKCITSHTSQADWTPDTAVSLWVRIDDPSIEYPEWRQPTGAHDAYAVGAKVTYNNKKWINTINANTYAPDAYGWTEVA